MTAREYPPGDAAPFGRSTSSAMCWARPPACASRWRGARSLPAAPRGFTWSVCVGSSRRTPDSVAHRAAAASSAARASTQVAPPSANSSFFQNGALVFSQSIRKAVASSAGWRCDAAASTSTMFSPAVSRPTRWITVQPSSRQRRSASCGDARDGALGHRRIVLQRHRGDAIPAHPRAPCRRSSRCRRYRCARRSARRIRRRCRSPRSAR